MQTSRSMAGPFSQRPQRQEDRFHGVCVRRRACRSPSCSALDCSQQNASDSSPPHSFAPPSQRLRPSRPQGVDLLQSTQSSFRRADGASCLPLDRVEHSPCLPRTRGQGPLPPHGRVSGPKMHQALRQLESKWRARSRTAPGATHRDPFGAHGVHRRPANLQCQVGGLTGVARRTLQR